MPDGSIQRVLQLAAQGVQTYPVEEYDTDWDSDAYYTVSGQNANNSVRVPDGSALSRSTATGTPCVNRTDGAVARKVPAAKLWNDITLAAWA